MQTGAPLQAGRPLLSQPGTPLGGPPMAQPNMSMPPPGMGALGMPPRMNLPSAAPAPTEEVCCLLPTRSAYSVEFTRQASDLKTRVCICSKIF